MPNTPQCFNCAQMKAVCNCKCKGSLLNLFKCQPFSKVFKYLRRHSARRRRSSKRFRSIHAVFWPLMSMRSDERERAPDNNPCLTEIDSTSADETVPQPLSIDPPAHSLASSNTKGESSAHPAASSYTKVQPTPPLNSSNNITANAEAEQADHPPILIATKAESSRSHPASSSHTKVEALFASSYIKMASQRKDAGEKKRREDFEVQKACRSFEKYILEMLVEERKVRDLLDVEELLYCMDNLKSPAFVELVCTFYGELCLDLFSDDQLGHQS